MTIHKTPAILLFLALQLTFAELTMANLTNILPDEVNGWENSNDDHTYNRETLYEYINGGAELYLSYGFKEVLSRKYVKTGQPNIMVEIFDMGSSINAFGVFSHSREVIDTTFGQGCQYTSGLMLFWKDKYLVSILASPETEESKKVVFSLAKSIDDKIPKEGPIPEIINLLPRKYLVQESVRYFRHYIWLNSHYYIADQNILHIENNTHAVLAKYSKEKKQSIVLLVNYPNKEKAELAYNSFVKHYLPELSNSPVVQIEDGTWTGCQFDDNLISIVFNAANKNWAKELLGSIR